MSNTSETASVSATTSEPQADGRVKGKNAERGRPRINEQKSVSLGGASPRSNAVNAAKSSQQPRALIPLNRYVLLVAGCIYCIFTGPVFLNWNPTLDYLTRSGVYAWECVGTGLEYDENGTCADQRKALALLSTVSQTLFFALSIVGGFLTDGFGPRIGCVIGTSMSAICYLFLACASEGNNLYLAAFIFAGASIDCCFYAVLCIANLFPRYRNSVMSILGAFRSISFAYSNAQKAMVGPLSLSQMAWTCFTINLVVGLTMAAMLPPEKFEVFYAEELPQTTQSPDVLPDSAESRKSATSASMAPLAFNQLPSRQQSVSHFDGPAGKEVLLEGKPSAEALWEMKAANPEETGTRNSLGEIVIVHMPGASSSSALALGDDALVALPATAAETAWAKNVREFKMCLRKAATPEYVAWCLFFSFAYSRITFYLTSQSDQNPAVVDAMSIISPFSFVPCPLLGFLSDLWSMHVVLLILNALSTVLYVCLMPGKAIGLQWINLICAVIILSFAGSQNYCYITESYDIDVAIKLAGLPMLIAGVFTFINTPLYNWATDSDSFMGPNILYLCSCGLCFACELVMFLRRHHTHDKKSGEGSAVPLAQPEVEEAHIP